jgi:DNA-binding response OmpR family regulator
MPWALNRIAYIFNPGGRQLKALTNEKKRILCVESDKDSCRLLSLQLSDFKFIFAHDFDEGLRQAQRRYVDFYLLGDLRPDGASVELCRRIRAFDPSTPILFYSGWADQSHKEKALAAGAQFYLTKPVHPEKLKQAIAQMTAAVLQSAAGARRAEIAVVREELAQRRMESHLTIRESRAKARRASEKLLRLKAHQAYLASGGTRGDFARQWAAGFLNGVGEESGSP